MEYTIGVSSKLQSELRKKVFSCRKFCSDETQRIIAALRLLWKKGFLAEIFVVIRHIEQLRFASHSYMGDG